LCEIEITDKQVAISQVGRFTMNIHAQFEALLSSGHSDVGGDDSIVSLGRWTANTGTPNEQAGTYAHEWGHQIFLHHNGLFNDRTNCNANHYSIMNYVYQFTNFYSARELDYSREKLQDLDERSVAAGGVGLNEPLGIRLDDGTAGGADVPREYNAVWKRGSVVLSELITTAQKAIDWSNSGGATQTSISRNINHFGFTECKSEAELGGAKAVLPGANDWRVVDYLMRESGNFALGVQALNPDTGLPGSVMGEIEPSVGGNDGTLIPDTTEAHDHNPEPPASLGTSMGFNNDGDFEADAVTPRIDEDGPEDEIDNDGDGQLSEDPPGDVDSDGFDNDDADCTNLAGTTHFFGDFDFVEDECFLANNSIRADRLETVDEDGSDQVDNDGDGLFSEDPPDIIKYSFDEGKIINIDSSPSVDTDGPNTSMAIEDSDDMDAVYSDDPNNVLQQILEYPESTGDAVYFDNGDGIVSAGDVRLAQPPIDPITGVPYPLGSPVIATDADAIAGLSLIPFDASEKHQNTDANGTYEPEEGIYKDVTEPFGAVSAGDTRIFVSNFIFPDTVVALGDSDITTPLDAFSCPDASCVSEPDIKHVDPDSDGMLDKGFRVISEQIAVDVDGNGIFHDAGVDASGAVVPVCLDDDESTVEPGRGQFPFRLKIGDLNGNIEVFFGAIEINNVSPTIESLLTTLGPTNIGTPITAASIFTDPGFLDTHDEPGSEWDWDVRDYHDVSDTTSASAAPSVLTELSILSACVPDPLNPGSISSTHDYDEPGLYAIKLSVDDKDGGSDTEETVTEDSDLFVVKVNTRGGQTKGDFKFISPVGLDPEFNKFDISGIVKVKFDVDYIHPQDDDPTNPHSADSTIFSNEKGQVPRVTFRNHDADWLVVTGNRAVTVGPGTLKVDGVNEPGNFAIFITAVAGNTPVDHDGFGGIGTPDLVRVKIFDTDTGEVIYDNEPGYYIDDPPETEAVNTKFEIIPPDVEIPPPLADLPGLVKVTKEIFGADPLDFTPFEPFLVDGVEVSVPPVPDTVPFPLPEFAPGNHLVTEFKTVITSVSTRQDDSEELIDTSSPPSFSIGHITRGSDDLEMANDPTFHGGNQLVGMRFTVPDLPQAANIQSAYLRFTVEDDSYAPGSLTISGQADDSPAQFTTTPFDLSSRPMTMSSALWIPSADWAALCTLPDDCGESGPNQLTTNFKDVVQEIVDRPGWAPGNKMVIFVTGDGEVTAFSYNGSPEDAPKLIISYTDGADQTMWGTDYTECGESQIITVVSGEIFDCNLLNTAMGDINHFPSVTIESPLDGDSFLGPSVDFESTAFDLEGPVTFEWFDNEVSTGITSEDPSIPLALGEHTIEVIVTDSGGRQASASVTITVSNEPPTVEITVPASDPALVQLGDTTDFTAVASDPEDGPLAGAAIVWTSDVDSPLGIGLSISFEFLTVGERTITVTATSPSGPTPAIDTITVIVSDEAPVVGEGFEVDRSRR